MATSRSDRRLAFEVVGGGPAGCPNAMAASPEEVAAIAAALELVLGGPSPQRPAVSRWRWSGRTGWVQTRADWRGLLSPAHPSRPVTTPVTRP